MLTANGSNFASGSQIQWNGSPLVTTYISSSQLSAQVPAGNMATGGTVQVTVSNPAAGGVTSNAQTFSVNYSTPALTSISPTVAVAGSPMTTLTATGGGFVPGTQIQWNNTPLPTTYVSTTQVTAQVPANDLATAGLATITVANPMPGGGAAPTSLPLYVLTGDTRTTSAAVAANHIAWDATHGLLYASVPGTNGAAGSVMAINPLTGSLGTPQPAGNGPNFLAVSSDASHLWVGEDGNSTVQRFALPNLTPDISIPLSSAAGYVAALDLKAAPDSPATVAVLSGNPGTPNQSYAVTVYDDATPRPTSTTQSTSGLASLAWGKDSSTLYGAQGEYGPFGLTVMGVNSSGVTFQTNYLNSLINTSTLNQQLHFDPPTGYLYSDDARVLNPATGDLIETCDAMNGLTAVDSAQGIVFSLGRTGPQGNSYTGYSLLAFDRATCRLLRTLSLPQATGGNPLGLVRWGNAGLAFNTAPGPYASTPGGIYFLDGSFVNSTATADFSSGTPVAPLPNLTSISPQSALAGSPATILTVTGAYFQPGAVVNWGNQPLSTAYINAAQLQATVPASYLATAQATIITVSNGTTTTQAQNQMLFTVSPSTSGITSMNLSARSLAWDKKSSLLYAAVDGSDPLYPNSIVVIDPVQGKVVKSQIVGSDPYLVRTSADGSYLYVGFAGTNSIAQLKMPALDSPSSWSLGTNNPLGPLVALDLQPAPGAPQTTAVSTGSKGAIPQAPERAYGSLTIFDNNVPRPTAIPENAYPTFYAFGNLQWGKDSSTLYAADLGDDLYTLAVNSSGATVVQDIPYGVENPILAADPAKKRYNYNTAFHYDAVTGYIYDDNGVIIDPVNVNLVHAFNTFGFVAEDSDLNRLFFLQYVGGYTLQSFDKTLFTPVNSITLSGVVGTPQAFVRWGTSGLAFSTIGTGPSLLYILNSPSFVSAN